MDTGNQPTGRTALYLQMKYCKIYTEQKRAIVVEFCVRGGNAAKIANSYGVGHSNLYSWREKMLAGECKNEMKNQRNH